MAARRLLKGSQEGAPHPIAIRETSLLSHGVKRLVRFLHQVSGGFQTQILDRLCR